jgi:hypothetical protein
MELKYKATGATIFFVLLSDQWIGAWLPPLSNAVEMTLCWEKRRGKIRGRGWVGTDVSNLCLMLMSTSEKLSHFVICWDRVWNM